MLYNQSREFDAGVVVEPFAETYIQLVESSNALRLVSLPPVACSLWADQVTFRFQLILVLQIVKTQLADSTACK